MNQKPGKMTMRIAVVSLLLFALAAARSPHAQDDVVMKAMHDELDRSMKQLQLENLEKPYFISYRVVDSNSTNASAVFGALDSSGQSRSRRLTVEVRVGGYQLDNTNFFSFNFNMSSMVQEFNGTAELPLDDDYKELRRQIWLVTDATYKKAVEDLAKKRAALENKTDTDNTPDFTRETPGQTAVEEPPIHVDRAQWENQVRSLSALFRQMPDIYTSNVSLSAVNAYVRYINSEGTRYTRQEPRVTFSARAATQATDGTPLDDFVWLYARSLDELPSSDELANRVRALGKRLQDLRTSSAIDVYNGPVLVEGDAAPQLFRLIFVPDLLAARRPMMDNALGMMRTAQAENPFIDKIGARVLPDFLSVTDNPTLAVYDGKLLAGYWKVDEDGVPTRETRLVDKGILQTLLSTRDPVRGIEHSTGSRHDGQAAPSNVFVTTENGLTEDELRAKFLEMVKQRNKEYGVVVRRMRNSQQPVLAWKIYADGHEELIHGVQFAGLNTAAFKDIAAASKSENLLTVEYRPQQSIVMISFGDEGYAPVTLAVPSFVLDDITVRKIRGEISKPPIVPPPTFEGNPEP
jgi:predicted Zn-dependent protease